MFFIPAEEYLMFFLSWVFLYVFLQIEAIFVSDSKISQDKEISATKQAMYVGAVVLIYAFFVVLGYLFRNSTANLLILMVIYVLIFCFCVSITIMFFKQIMGPFRKMVKSSSSKTKPVTLENEQVDEKSEKDVNQSHITDGEKNEAFAEVAF